MGVGKFDTQTESTMEDFASQLANLQRAATRAGGSSSDSNGNVSGSIRGFVEEGSDGVRHTSTTSLRRKIVDEGGYHDASLSNQDSNKRTRHAVTTTTIYQRPNVPVQTIYIACPANIETGGPEALHQLCHVINNIGEDITTMLPPRRDNDCGIDCGGGGSKQCNTKNNMGAGDVRAFMLYLRERNDNGGTNNNAAKGGGMRRMEHVISTTACPTRYARYDAPPAPNLPGHNNSSSSNGAATNNGVVSTVHSSEMVIWPECWTHLIDTLLPPHPPVGQTTATTNVSYQNVIWWLSVDNNKGSFTTKDFVNRRDVLHLVQSAYAYNYVSSHLRHRKDNDDNVNDEKSSNRTHHPDVIDLTEYIWQPSPSSNNNNLYPPAEESADNAPSPAVIVTATPSQQILHRDIDVVYNPAKGMHYTNEIIRRAGQTLQIVPIGKGLNGQIRMTGNEVTNLLCRAKVYIDFGPHPGMDRLPREAALAGCIVLTNREGAAGYDVDVPLPTEFKFGGLFNVEKVYALLRDICVSSSSSNKSEEEEEKRRYEVYVNKMKPYENWIHGQEGRMRDCVDRFINKVVTLRQMC
jgi:hypothetical protein